jgi:hypothetical protein
MQQALEAKVAGRSGGQIIEVQFLCALSLDVLSGDRCAGRPGRNGTVSVQEVAENPMEANWLGQWDRREDKSHRRSSTR